MKNSLSIVLLVSTLNVLPHIRCDSNGPIVKTKLGAIQGVVRVLDDERTTVNVFDGIRYAEAPTGAQRFKHPIPVTKYNGTYDATKFRYSCPQIMSLVPDDAPINEDCLFLSVWQPSEPLANDQKRSVMVFIHGGTYMSGTEFTVLYDGRWFASIGDVILVTINYRLGALGFLYGGSDDIPGNAGLYDQIAAIKWVKDNIDAFGGDSNTITIFGESAGSFSVGALIVSPLTRGLFKRAIMESGSPDSLIGSDPIEKQLVKYNALVDKLKCTANDTKEVVKCMQNVKVSDILDAGEKALVNLQVMNPTYGTPLLPKRPLEALRHGDYDPDITLMYGNNKDEGSLFLTTFIPNLRPENNPKLTVATAKTFISLIYNILPTKNTKDIAGYYTKGLKDDQNIELLRAVSNALGDFILTCPTVLYGKQFATTHKSKSYAYRLTHRPSISALGCTGWMGVCHADELVFLYGFPIILRGITFTEDDYKLSKDMIHVWSTFAKTGAPPAIDGVEWPLAIGGNSTDIKYMELNPNGYKILESYYKENCEEFWASALE